MGSNNDDNGSNRPDRPNEIRLQAGRIEVELQGYASEKELMELASAQMTEQMRRWCEVDRQVVSTEAEGLFAIDR